MSLRFRVGGEFQSRPACPERTTGLPSQVLASVLSGRVSEHRNCQLLSSWSLIWALEVLPFLPHDSSRGETNMIHMQTQLHCYLTVDRGAPLLCSVRNVHKVSRVHRVTGRARALIPVCAHHIQQNEPLSLPPGDSNAVAFLSTQPHALL